MVEWFLDQIEQVSIVYTLRTVQITEVRWTSDSISKCREKDSLVGKMSLVNKTSLSADSSITLVQEDNQNMMLSGSSTVFGHVLRWFDGSAEFFQQ